ncbi:MAG: HEAT repeat domain-containing protein, partial [Saprospiraceae bacterium]|nr:HEAT repeat domain-containing protein [Saprospiraceae bacterium]
MSKVLFDYLIRSISFLVFLVPLHGQDSLDVTTRIDQLLEKLPATNQEQMLIANRTLITMGPEAIGEVIQRLVTPGFGNDEAARYAVSGLAKYLGSAPTPVGKTLVEQEFLKAINSSSLKLDVQAFLIDQLQYFGTDASVIGLKEIAGTICEPVVSTWMAIRSQASLQALIDALPSVMGTCKINATKSIASFGDPRAIAILKSLTSDPDPVIQEIALEGLARNGDPSAYPILLERTKSDPRDYDRLIQYGSIRGQSGDVTTVKNISKMILKGDQNTRIKNSALAMSSTYLGIGAKKYLLKALKKGDSEHRAGAIDALALNPDIPLTSILKYHDQLPVNAQMKLLSIAGTRKVSQALPYLRNALSDSNKDLKLVAIRALSSIQGPQSITDLAPALRSNSDPEILRQIAAELSHWTDTSRMNTLVNLIDNSPSTARVALIDVLAERGGSALFPSISQALSANDADVRSSAFAALPKMAPSVGIEELVNLIPSYIRSEGRNQLL